MFYYSPAAHALMFMFAYDLCGMVMQAAITTQIYVKALKRADGTGSKADIVAMVCVPIPVH